MSIPTIQARIERVRALAPDVREVVLAPLGPPLEFMAGQWISVQLPIGPHPPLIRAYSLAAPPSPAGELVLCLDLVPGGLGSSYLHGLEPDAELTIAGPFGNFVLPDPAPPRLLLAARFTGVVPIRSMLLDLARQGWPVEQVDLVYGARDSAELIYHAEFVDWAAHHPGARYFPSAPGGGPGIDSRSEIDIVRELAAQTSSPSRFVPMVSGVKEFVRPLRQMLIEEFGFARRAVRCEIYN
jgi:ferredoxin-NADP reductase